MDEQDVTVAESVPPHETTSSPVDVDVAMPRYFGITPPTLLFGVACATLAIAIVLAVLGHWIAALVLAVVVLGEIAMFVSVASRKPDSGVARASSTARSSSVEQLRVPRRGCGARAAAPAHRPLVTGQSLPPLPSLPSSSSSSSATFTRTSVSTPFTDRPFASTTVPAEKMGSVTPAG